MAARNKSNEDGQNESIASFKANGLSFALIAGFFAALASFSAKLALDSGYIQGYMCGKDGNYEVEFRPFPKFLGNNNTFIEVLFKCGNVVLLLRGVSAVMIVLSNVLMFRSFSKSLLLCSSAAEATITNTAANFFISALFGCLFFRERFSQTWLIGTTFIIIGLAVIHLNKVENGDLNLSKKTD